MKPYLRCDFGPVSEKGLVERPNTRVQVVIGRARAWLWSPRRMRDAQPLVSELQLPILNRSLRTDTQCFRARAVETQSPMRGQTGATPPRLPTVQCPLGDAVHPYHHVDPADAIARRRLRYVFDAHHPGRNVHQRVVILDEKMVVLGSVGVEICPGPVDRYLA